ncbi:MAG: endolytic transglycosylase MltG, partial [Myxococcales bacterium]|nr:endolytic transglycosylase MltG [Myxococcales bacterium]
VPACAGFSGKVTPALNRDPKNRYSTYVVQGLPPGPIANPGEAALRAAVSPAKTDYLFFVARGGGRHTFTRTYAEHQRAVESP